MNPPPSNLATLLKDSVSISKISVTYTGEIARVSHKFLSIDGSPIPPAPTSNGRIISFETREDIAPEKLNTQIANEIKPQKKGYEQSLEFLLGKNNTSKANNRFSNGLYNVLNGHNENISKRARDGPRENWEWVNAQDKSKSRFESISRYLENQLETPQELSREELEERVQYLNSVNDILDNYSYFDKKRSDNSKIKGTFITKSNAFNDGFNKTKAKLDSLLQMYETQLKPKLERKNMVDQFNTFLHREIEVFRKEGVYITEDGSVTRNKGILLFNRVLSAINPNRKDKTTPYVLLSNVLDIYNSIKDGETITNPVYDNLISGHKQSLIEFLNGGRPHSSVIFSYTDLIKFT